jgi:hypothetical protein
VLVNKAAEYGAVKVTMIFSILFIIESTNFLDHWPRPRNPAECVEEHFFPSPHMLLLHLLNPIDSMTNAWAA